MNGYATIKPRIVKKIDILLDEALKTQVGRKVYVERTLPTLRK